MRRSKKRWLSRVARAITYAVLLCVGGLTGALLTVRYVDPPFTSVHAQRRVESLFSDDAYAKRYQFVPLERMSRNLQHAVIAAEDGRFYEHGGIDWMEIEKVVSEEIPRGRVRGASTITQQLVKNLFLTTHRNPLRKPVEFIFAPVAEAVLSKDRILELYLNVIEWGPGIYGAEAAAQHYYGEPAVRLNREQAARLAACLPAPRRWRPEQMDRYARIILSRMEGRGW